jgi:hypothetical protein
MYKLAVLLIFMGFCSASVLLTNGDFEQPLTTGWEQTLGSYSHIERATTYDPDPDYEVWVSDSFGNYAKLWQTTDIPTTDLEFSVYAKLDAFDNNEDTLCWGGAAVILTYLDETGSYLGETRICRFTTPCPWTDSPTCHLIIVPDTNWHTYSFNINAELANLSGVNPLDVYKIDVALYAETDHTC